MKKTRRKRSRKTRRRRTKQRIKGGNIGNFFRKFKKTALSIGKNTLTNFATNIGSMGNDGVGVPY